MKQYWYTFRETHPRYIKYVRLYALIWLALFIFDVHKYGCWITGDATYWYPISYILIPVSLLPFLPWGISKWVVWAENTGKQYTYNFVLLWVPGLVIVFGLYLWMSGGHIFNPDWWDKGLMGILRSDGSTLAAAGVIIFLAFCLWLPIREGKNPFKM